MALRRLVYIRAGSDAVIAREVSSAREYEVAPDVAIDTSTLRVLGVGAEARALLGTGALVESGFGIGANLIRDMDLAQIVLRHALKRVLTRPARRWRIFQFKPHVILHFTGKSASGSAELLADQLHALGVGIGARTITQWTGPALSDQDIRRGRIDRRLGWQNVAAYAGADGV